jgi:hypothetical protein
MNKTKFTLGKFSIPVFFNQLYLLSKWVQIKLRKNRHNYIIVISGIRGWKDIKYLAKPVIFVITTNFKPCPSCRVFLGNFNFITVVHRPARPSNLMSNDLVCYLKMTQITSTTHKCNPIYKF